ncbi:MAG: Gfo/Idh/MocA family oxidoreductase [Chloroflexota bacterium]
MTTQRIHIGIVGAGRNVRLRHVPGFRAIQGVDLVGVCNRTRESSQRVATEFGIPKVYDNWLDMVEDDGIDAICIGTWPYMHCSVTLAALDNEKHVLTEARMAMDATEAHAMLETSRAAPHLVTQVVPSPFTFQADQTIQEMVASGYLGELLVVDMRVTQRNFVDVAAPLTWRQDRDVSGYNILMMGVWYEAMQRWIGPASKVMAMTKTAILQRRNAEGLLRPVTIPDHVDILCQMACGAQAHMHLSSVTGLAPAGEVWLYGTEGTLRLDAETMKLYGGRRGAPQLREIEIPQEKQGSWRVEQEFINAIRGIEQVKFTTFEAGVQYMEFTEAVTRSAQSGEAISLPL